MDEELERIKKLCKVEIEAGSFFNGNIQACEFTYWVLFSGYKVAGMDVGKCSSIDALGFMKKWAQE